MRTLDEIRTDYEAHTGVCSEYGGRWDAAKSRRELFDMGCSIQGMDFLVKGMDGGYGFTSGEIYAMFHGYLNHRYVSVQHRGTGREYDGAIWCEDSGSAYVDVTCACFLHCNMDVEIRPYHVCHIFADRTSDLRLICPESSSVIFHGHDESADFGGCSGRIRINQGK